MRNLFQLYGMGYFTKEVDLYFLGGKQRKLFLMYILQDLMWFPTSMRLRLVDWLTEKYLIWLDKVSFKSHTPSVSILFHKRMTYLYISRLYFKRSFYLNDMLISYSRRKVMTYLGLKVLRVLSQMCQKFVFLS